MAGRWFVVVLGAVLAAVLYWRYSETGVKIELNQRAITEEDVLNDVPIDPSLTGEASGLDNKEIIKVCLFGTYLTSISFYISINCLNLFLNWITKQENNFNRNKPINEKHRWGWVLCLE